MDRNAFCGRRDFLLAGAAAALLALGGRAARAQGSANPLKIGVIGSGHIGGTVGSLWVKAGHPVLFSSRHPEELKELVGGLGSLARAGTPAEAASFGDVIFLAVPYGALPQIGHDLGPAMSGKVVLLPANAVAGRDGAALASEAQSKGLGVAAAGYLPGVRLVRAFNTFSYRILQKDAHRPEGLIAIPLAGDDQGALKVASDLVRDAGFEPVVVGPLSRSGEFSMGTPMYGQEITAQEFRQKFNIPQ